MFSLFLVYFRTRPLYVAKAGYPPVLASFKQLGLQACIDTVMSITQKNSTIVVTSLGPAPPKHSGLLWEPLAVSDVSPDGWEHIHLALSGDSLGALSPSGSGRKARMGSSTLGRLPF